MGKRNFLLASFLLFCSGIWAKEVIDTLESTNKDRVIITYDVSHNNEQFVIKFLDAKKKLGRTFKDKYNKLNEVAVLFFDRTGNFEDKTEFSGISTNAFMIPASVNYKKSSDGYFILNDNPTLKMELKSAESENLKIPIFLAHYEGKKRYKIFSRCGDLIVKLSKRKQTVTQSSPTTQFTTQTITTQEEVEETFTDVDEANILINKVSDLLALQQEYPFSDELKQAISSLRDRSYRITDARVSSRISDVLSACKLKEDELKEEANAAAEAAAKNAEAQAKRAEEQALARQDSIAAVAQQKADKERKQNIWMIIGGIILAVVAFVSNQVLQHFRNAKNQKSMIDMQQNVVKRAENEAKRRARNMAQSQINRAEGEARRKTRNAIKDGIGKIGKGNKGISI